MYRDLKLSRRKLIAKGGELLLLFATGTSILSCNSSPEKKVDLSCLKELVYDNTSASYLVAKLGKTREMQDKLESLVGEIEHILREDCSNLETIQSLLSDKIKEDFLQDNTLILDGWIVSHTEAILIELVGL